MAQNDAAEEAVEPEQLKKKDHLCSTCFKFVFFSLSDAKMSDLLVLDDRDEQHPFKWPDERQMDIN